MKAKLPTKLEFTSVPSRTVAIPTTGYHLAGLRDHLLPSSRTIKRSLTVLMYHQ
jgi:hypothetical protein